MSAGAAPDNELDERRLRLTVEHVASVRWQIVSVVVVVGLLVYGTVPTAAIVAWGLAVIVAREVVVLVHRRWCLDPAVPVGRRLRLAIRVDLLVGLTQGAATLFMLWLDRAHDAVLTMILVSLVAGAVSTSALVPGWFLVYASCVLVPTALFWVFDGDAFGIGVALLVAMFYGVQLRFARANLQTFEESFRIRRENEQLVREVQEARDRAEAASRAKTRFLAAASHDLRQPLHAMSLQGAALALDPAAPDAPRIARSINESIDGLSTLLDALLDISRLDAGTLRVDERPIQLSRLLDHLACTFTPLAEAKGLEFSAQAPAGIVATTDPVLLERVLRNLLDNAVKYTDQGSIHLSLAVGPDGGEIVVADTGRGIAAEHRERVFEEFFQVVPGEGDGPRGLGLGLSIVRRLAVLLDARLQLDSQPGRGTTVRLHLSADRFDGGTAPAPGVTAAHDDLAGLRVLVVDDDAEVREATRIVLERLGCVVAIAGDGAGAMQVALAHRPDLLLSDYRLGQGDTGVALIRRLRETLPALPAALISGAIEPDTLREAHEAGVALLHKPLSIDRLRQAIAELAAQPAPGSRS